MGLDPSILAAIKKKTHYQTIGKRNTDVVFYDIEVLDGVFVIVFKFLFGIFVEFRFVEKTFRGIHKGKDIRFSQPKYDISYHNGNTIYSINEIPKLKTYMDFLILNGFYLISYNGKHYDNIILNYIYNTPKPRLSKIKEISDSIISELRTTDVAKFSYPSNTKYKAIDMILTGNLSKPAPRSLKLAAAAAEFYNIEEFDFNIPIDSEEVLDKLASYCHTDVEALEHITWKLKKEIDIRLETQELFGVDVMMQDSSGISNAVFPVIYSKKTGKPLGEIKRMSTSRKVIEVKSIILDIIKYKDPVLNKVLYDFKNSFVNGTGELTLNYEPFVYNRVKFQLGAGGIHTVDKGAIFEDTTDDSDAIIDVDGTSFYPNLMFVYRFYPEHLGISFSELIGEMIKLRVDFKYQGRDGEAYVFKIVLNSSFGKMNAAFPNWLKDSKAALSVTVNGQLLLLMCAEMGVETGAQVISANTDGLTFLVNKKKLTQFDNAMKEWSKITKVQLEYTRYRKYIRANVNNYIAEKYIIKGSDDIAVLNAMTIDSCYQPYNKYKFEIKRKGSLMNQFVHRESFMKVLDKPIVAKAVEEYFMKGIDPKITIDKEDNLYMFTSCKKISKTFEVMSFTTDDDDEYYAEGEGNIIRFYVSKSPDAIKIKKIKRIENPTIKNRKVKIVVDLLVGHGIQIVNDMAKEDIFEHDIKREYYEHNARKLIYDIQKEDKRKFVNEQYFNGDLFAEDII